MASTEIKIEWLDRLIGEIHKENKPWELVQYIESAGEGDGQESHEEKAKTGGGEVDKEEDTDSNSNFPFKVLRSPRSLN